MYGVILHAHPVRGESHNQRNTTGEVATIPYLSMWDCCSIIMVHKLVQGGPRLRVWRATLRFEENITGRKERNSIAIKRLVCCSNRPNFCCTPNASFGFGAIFEFSVCLFATQSGDFLLEKRYTTHQQNSKTIFCFLILVVKSMSAVISVVSRRKQACRFHQPF